MNIKFGILSLLSSVAFQAGGGWKLDADGRIEMKDGNPVYINSAGAEQVVNGNTISDLNREAKTHREAKEAAEKKLKDFEGLDPVETRKMLDKYKDVDLSKMVESGKLDEVKREITQQFTVQLNEKDKALADKDTAFNNLLIQNMFGASEFLRDRVAIPAEFFQAAFKENFKVEDGKISAYDRNGNRLMSKKNMGEYADPNEAMEMLVEMHPNKDAILRPNGGGGSGSNGNSGGRGGGRYMKRADFEALDPMKKAAAATQMQKGEIEIVD